MTTISDVWMSSSIDPWCRLGFADFPISQPDGSTVPCLSIAGLGFRFMPELSDPSALGSCVSGWTLVSDLGSGDRDLLSVDGIATRVIAEPVAAPQLTHALNVASIDHLVITTGSLDRTCGAITEQLGLPLKRIRDAGHGVRQRHRHAGARVRLDRRRCLLAGRRARGERAGGGARGARAHGYRAEGAAQGRVVRP